MSGKPYGKVEANLHHEFALLLWMKLKRSEWTSHKQLSPRARGQVDQLKKEVGEDWRGALAKALWWAANKEEFFAGKPMAFENIGSNSKLMQYADKYDSNIERQSSREAPAKPSLRSGQVVTVRGAQRATVQRVEGVRVHVRYVDGLGEWVYRDEVE